LDGVVISGGEPTLQRDLFAFALRVHEMGFLVKLDTNGYRPDVLGAMMQEGLVDYVALDVKAPMKKYALAAGIEVDTRRIQQSIRLLLDGAIACEFRTTVVPGMLDADDVAQIARMIRGADRYYLQQFVPHNTLDPALSDLVPYLPTQIQSMADLVKGSVSHVGVRGI
jgi:pyruvate formate lyase activating enzyme